MRLYALISVAFVIFLKLVNGQLSIVQSNDQLKQEGHYKHWDFIINYTFQTDYLSIVEIVEDVDNSRPSVFVTEFLHYLYLGEIWVQLINYKK